MPPAFKPAYLIHGDDHGRLAERRARLRALAERESGSQGIEVFEGDAATAEAVATALSAMTFAIGRRFLIVDGVERWKAADMRLVEPALKTLPPDTTVVFFGREEGRAKVPDRLIAAVRAAGGDVSTELTVKPWDLPKWAVAQARGLGLELHPSAARALVAHVGERQQRLLRELEKLALELGEGARIDLEQIEEITASSAERKVWTLADALVARDGLAATRVYFELREQGERLAGLLYTIARRLRDALDVAQRLETGESASQVRRGLRMPPKAAERFVADVQRTDVAGLRAALGIVADLELASRGGAGSGLSEDTLAIGAIARLTA
ncbi:DNA polymerase III subunit delta [Conexibacter woesei]|uniref:DNA-directed DNA polymerase n=1 Tax=Conexibacter woesei (strain DSM 14684 / CCUG 47730 / CIP 108061 / JCM 11494 / NBRC 100937 / ID131577) TaxID=469383 RepID=D3FAU0_CONWI|nr:DNA polymerase III subunit delta [Conexibacter woesei]ADB51253.1 DNA polymerase III, delta subunit [Conexibacter woesei DSM 14684]